MHINIKMRVTNLYIVLLSLVLVRFSLDDLVKWKLVQFYQKKSIVISPTLTASQIQPNLTEQKLIITTLVALLVDHISSVAPPRTLNLDQDIIDMVVFYPYSIDKICISRKRLGQRGNQP